MRIIRILLVILLCVGLVIGGLVAYTHFVTNSIADVGGMENPDFADDAEFAQGAHYQESNIIDDT